MAEEGADTPSIFKLFNDMAASKKTTRTLTLRLLRVEKKIADAFNPGYSEGSSRALKKRAWKNIENSWLYTGQIYSNPPGWLSFIEKENINESEKLSSSGAGAVIFMPVNKRVIAICFGHIHIALEDDAFEHQFGLKIALNSIPSHQIRSIDIATPDAVTFQKRVQASKDSDLSQFGFDTIRDLARVAGGTPKDKNFAKFIAGKDSLSITCELDANDLKNKCREVLEVYEKNDYRLEYSWFDNLQIVRDESTIKKLDEKLFTDLEKIINGGLSPLHLTPPEIIDYMDGSELHYNGFGSHGLTFNKLSIEDYVGELKKCKFAGGIDDIKAKHRIKSKSRDSGTFTEQWKVYDCFIFETTLSTNGSASVFSIFGGRWYCVGQSFKKQVEEYFNKIEKISIVGKTTSRNEQELIDDLHKNRKDLLKLDKEKINPKGVKGANLEPCDFFSDKKHFIHLKDASSSGPISHLWSQAVVSAEALVGDQEFLRKLREIVRKKGRPKFTPLLPKPSTRITREEYTIVFGLMRNPYANGNIDIPFFSKVSFQPAAQRLEQLGFPVAIELIEKI